jgi:vanillate O-demethylase ferredoxin subunit
VRKHFADGEPTAREEIVTGQPKPATTLELFVRQVRYEGGNVQSYELVDANGADLPPFTAGAHIDIHLADGIVRQYSLCNSPQERGRYVIAVLRDDRGRGGSKAVHDRLRVQDTVHVSRPRNNFELVDDAGKIVLLAGGIGVTPLKAMAHQLKASGTNHEMHYCARDVAAAAFSDELTALLGEERLHLHFDDGDRSRGLDIERLLRDEAGEGVHIYCCGPAGFMSACAEASTNWPKGSVHFEHFKPPDPVILPAADDMAGLTEEFTIEIASTGKRLAVPRDRSIAEVLRAANVPIETSCEAGLCATCKVRYLAGEVEHNDYILDDEDHEHFLTVCVSRAKSDLLVLDL